MLFLVVIMFSTHRWVTWAR